MIHMEAGMRAVLVTVLSPAMPGTWQELKRYLRQQNGSYQREGQWGRRKEAQGVKYTGRGGD